MLKTKPAPLRRLDSGLEKSHPFLKAVYLSQKFGMNFLEKTWQPPTDVFETPSHFIVRIEIPGVRVPDFTIHLDERNLVVRGRRTESFMGSRRTFKQMEINYGHFERVIPLPGPLDLEQARAAYEQGFLEIAIPRTRRGRTHAVQVTVTIEG